MFTPNISSLTPHIDNFEMRQSFDLGNDNFVLFGSTTTPKRNMTVLHYDSKKKRAVFKDISKGDEDFIKPYFFKTTFPSDPILILCTKGADYTYGVSVYAFNKNTFNNIGYMDIALNEKPDSSTTDPVPWTQISINDDEIKFSFSKSVSTDFQGQQQKNYEAGQLTYHYRDGKLSMWTK